MPTPRLPAVPLPGKYARLFVDAGAKVRHAAVNDISPGGISVRVFTDSGLSLARGDKLTGCPVKLSNNTLRCTLDVRYVANDGTLDCWVLGARFVSLSRSNLETLTQFIANVETDLEEARPPSDVT